VTPHFFKPEKVSLISYIPFLQDGVGQTGWVYKVTQNGVYNFGSGNVTHFWEQVQWCYLL
jgi:hypothetical protein